MEDGRGKVEDGRGKREEGRGEREEQCGTRIAERECRGEKRGKAEKK